MGSRFPMYVLRISKFEQCILNATRARELSDFSGDPGHEKPIWRYKFDREHAKSMPRSSVLSHSVVASYSANLICSARSTKQDDINDTVYNGSEFYDHIGVHLFTLHCRKWLGP